MIEERLTFVKLILVVSILVTALDLPLEAVPVAVLVGVARLASCVQSYFGLRLSTILADIEALDLGVVVLGLALVGVVEDAGHQVVAPLLNVALLLDRQSEDRSGDKCRKDDSLGEVHSERGFGRLIEGV